MYKKGCEKNMYDNFPQTDIHIEPFNQLHSTKQIGAIIVLDRPAKEFDGFKLRIEGQSEWVETSAWDSMDCHTHPVIFDGLKVSSPYKIEGQYCLNNNWIPLNSIITHTSSFDDPWAIYRYYVEGIQPEGGCIVEELPDPVEVGQI